MTSQYHIIIQNMSAQTMSFYAFQKQASFTDSGAVPSVLSSSLACGSLAPHDSSGAQLGFAFDTQNYVGATCSILPSSTPAPSAMTAMASETSAASEASAVQPINLTTPDPSQSVKNCSTLTISPLGLATPVYQSGLAAGSFGIEIPTFEPESVTDLYCGCATINQDGSIVLSSYIVPLPGGEVGCAPTPYYYVKTGSFPVGEAIPYDTSQSASCDFSGGYSTFDVQYNSNGSFTITGSF